MTGSCVAWSYMLSHMHDTWPRPKSVLCYCLFVCSCCVPGFTSCSWSMAWLRLKQKSSMICWGIGCELGWICTGSRLDSVSCLVHFSVRVEDGDFADSAFLSGMHAGSWGVSAFCTLGQRLLLWIPWRLFVAFASLFGLCLFVCFVFPISIVKRAASFADGISPKMHPSRVEIRVSEM